MAAYDGFRVGEQVDHSVRHRCVRDIVSNDLHACAVQLLDTQDGSAGIKLTSGADVTHHRPKWISDSARVRTGHVIFHEPGAPFGGLVLPTSSMSGCAQQFGPEMVSGCGLM